MALYFLHLLKSYEERASMLGSEAKGWRTRAAKHPYAPTPKHTQARQAKQRLQCNVLPPLCAGEMNVTSNLAVTPGSNGLSVSHVKNS